jgi:hypothetical protein
MFVPLGVVDYENEDEGHNVLIIKNMLKMYIQKTFKQ